MNLKQIKTIIVACTVVISSFIGSITFSQTSQAYKCPTGEVFHADDNSCYATKEVSTPCGRAQCKQTVTEKTSSVPTNDDGSAVSFSCPAGQEYHASDGACYTTKQVPGCSGRCTVTEYTKTNAKPTISPDPSQSGATFCKNATPQYADACTDGQNGADCNAKYANQAERAACQTGTASTLCGMTTSQSSANAAEYRRDCYNGVQQCLNSGKTGTDLQDCLKNVAGVDDTKVGQTAATGKTSAASGTCGKAKTNLISCQGEGLQAIGDVLRQIILIMSILVGILAVGGIVYAAILYAAATDNAAQTKKAIEIIRNIVIGILVYGFMVAIINWLVPGGVIG